jgi:hypothetical protein
MVNHPVARLTRVRQENSQDFDAAHLASPVLACKTCTDIGFERTDRRGAGQEKQNIGLTKTIYIFRYVRRVDQNHIYTPYMTIYLIKSLPRIPYIHRIYMVLANSVYSVMCQYSVRYGMVRYGTVWFVWYGAVRPYSTRYSAKGWKLPTFFSIVSFFQNTNVAT